MRIFTACFLVFTISSNAFAFSSGGHRIIAEIAWRQLVAEKRAEFVDLLKHHPRFEQDFVKKMPDSVRKGSQELEDHWLFLEASVWPDTVRGLKGDERKKYHRGTWHYINLPTYMDTDHMREIDLSRVNRSNRVARGFHDDASFNIIQALKVNLAGLRDHKRTKAEKAVHLCWISHLVGDAHQPLHSTALFTLKLFGQGDRGGNLIKTDKGNNLHSVWDRLLPYERTIGGVGGVATRLIDAKESLLKEAIEHPEPEVWIAESVKLAGEMAYSREVRLAVSSAETNDESSVTASLSEEYLTAAGGVAQRRVVQAGSRLAAVLKGKELPPFDEMTDDHRKAVFLKAYVQEALLRRLPLLDAPDHRAILSSDDWLVEGAKLTGRAKNEWFAAMYGITREEFTRLTEEGIHRWFKESLDLRTKQKRGQNK